MDAFAKVGVVLEWYAGYTQGGAVLVTNKQVAQRIEQLTHPIVHEDIVYEIYK
jgi:hypothetical protein